MSSAEDQHVPPLVGNLLDTWGSPCAYKGCEEPIRTIGFEYAVDDGSEEGRIDGVVLCQQHFFELMERHVFGRRISRVVG